MVESLVIKEYAQNRLGSLEEVLRKKKDGFSIEDFHDIRVEIKKLNAISRILKFCYRPFNRRKFIEPYKKLFSCAGKIREAQLETALFEELQLAGSLGSYLKNKNAQLIKDKGQFEKMAKSIRKKIDRHTRTLEPCFNKITREKIYSFAVNLNNQVTSIVREVEWTDEEIHELRKKLKELLYTINIFQISGTESKSIDALQDMIGKWHDKMVIAGQLSDKKLLKKINRQERVTMQLVVEYLNHSAVQMLDKITGTIRRHQKGKALIPTINPSKPLANRAVAES